MLSKPAFRKIRSRAFTFSLHFQRCFTCRVGYVHARIQQHDQAREQQFQTCHSSYQWRWPGGRINSLCAVEMKQKKVHCQHLSTLPGDHFHVCPQRSSSRKVSPWRQSSWDAQWSSQQTGCRCSSPSGALLAWTKPCEHHYNWHFIKIASRSFCEVNELMHALQMMNSW